MLVSVRSSLTNELKGQPSQHGQYDEQLDQQQDRDGHLRGSPTRGAAGHVRCARDPSDALKTMGVVDHRWQGDTRVEADLPMVRVVHREIFDLTVLLADADEILLMFAGGVEVVERVVRLILIVVEDEERFA